MNGTIKYIVLSVWLLLLRTMLLIFIHVVTCIRSFFFFIAE